MAMSYRYRANWILGLLFALFLLVRVIKQAMPGVFLLDVCHAGLEAALAGGIADWFAVTALFRKPLGFSWHTAILVRNRQRMIEAIADFVERDLLSVAALKQRLAQTSVTTVLIAWVEREGQTQPILTDWLLRHRRLLVAWLHSSVMTQLLENVIKQAATDSLQLAPTAKQAVGWMIEQGYYRHFFDWVATELLGLVRSDKSKDAIYQYLQEFKASKERSLLGKTVIWLGEQTDSINLEEAAAAVHAELVLAVEEFAGGETPLRTWLEEQVINLAETFQQTADWDEAVEHWKVAVLTQPEVYQTAVKLIQALVADSLTPRSPVHRWLLWQSGRLWRQFKQDAPLRKRLDREARRLVSRMLESRHELIGLVIRQALASFSDERLSRFVESKVGNDLQWIRINGSVVGGLVGIVLFLFLHFLYEPLLAVVH